SDARTGSSQTPDPGWGSTAPATCSAVRARAATVISPCPHGLDVWAAGYPVVVRMVGRRECCTSASAWNRAYLLVPTQVVNAFLRGRGIARPQSQLAQIRTQHRGGHGPFAANITVVWDTYWRRRKQPVVSLGVVRVRNARCPGCFEAPPGRIPGEDVDLVA